TRTSHRADRTARWPTEPSTSTSRRRAGASGTPARSPRSDADVYAKVNGTRIFFDVDGPGVVFEGLKDVERPTLLLLPGGPGASHMHYKRPDAGFERLTSRFQTGYMDWRGAARSD